MDDTVQLITRFLSEEPEDQKWQTIGLIINTFNLPETLVGDATLREQLYTFYDATKILPKLVITINDIMDGKTLQDRTNTKIISDIEVEHGYVKIKTDHFWFSFRVDKILDFAKNIIEYVDYCLRVAKDLFLAIIWYMCDNDDKIRTSGIYADILYRLKYKQLRLLILPVIISRDENCVLFLSSFYSQSIKKLLDYNNFNIANLIGHDNDKQIIIEYVQRRYSGVKTKNASKT